jgi:hypothetical protein
MVPPAVLDRSPEMPNTVESLEFRARPHEAAAR